MYLHKGKIGNNLLGFAWDSIWVKIETLGDNSYFYSVTCFLKSLTKATRIIMELWQKKVLDPECNKFEIMSQSSPVHEYTSLLSRSAFIFFRNYTFPFAIRILVSIKVFLFEQNPLPPKHFGLICPT